MAIRPRQRGKKNKPDTMKEFMAAVSGILKTEGFYGLRVSNIARFCRRNRNLINRYFGSLEGLKRAYITVTDYWGPVLERFSIIDADDMEEVRDTFTELMQETFRNFLNNAEMQKLILWQISQEHPLLTQVSTEREIKGERLFSKSDPGFESTLVNFRAVIGLLLGGIYYMVLHAKTNKSVVCGIDLNREEDQEQLLKTIAQVIDWACAAANDNETNSQSKPMMNNQFELLDRIAAELSERKTPASAPSQLLVTECKRLKRDIPNHVLGLKNETQIRSYLKMVVTKLGEVLDELYDPEFPENPDADLLIELLKVVLRHHYDVIPSEVILPKLYCISEAGDFNQIWLRIKTGLESVGIELALINLIYFPFNRMSLSSTEVTLYDFKYLKMFGSVLSSEIPEAVMDEASLVELLIGLGYNHSRFKAFYTTGLKQKIHGKELAEKQAILEEEFVWVGQASSRTPLMFDLDRPAMVEDLHNWINIELKKGMGLNVSADGAIFDNSFNTALSTSELSAFQKLQFDAGVYLESNIDVFTGKVSHNFKTKRGMRPSGRSVKSKLYGKEVETFRVLRPIVNKMKEDIDRFLM